MLRAACEGVHGMGEGSCVAAAAPRPLRGYSPALIPSERRWGVSKGRGLEWTRGRLWCGSTYIGWTGQGLGAQTLVCRTGEGEGWGA